MMSPWFCVDYIAKHERHSESVNHLSAFQYLVLTYTELCRIYRLCLCYLHLAAAFVKHQARAAFAQALRALAVFCWLCLLCLFCLCHATTCEEL